MATAKQRTVKVRDFMSGKQIKVECEACYNEEGSYACVRPAHKPKESPYKIGVDIDGPRIKVVQDEVPVEKEVLATAIIQISNAVHKLAKSGLNRKGIIALINDDTKLGKGTIETVLLSLENLAKTYTK